MLVCFKGTHARDIPSLFLNFFLLLSVTKRYKTQYSQIFENVLKIRPDIQIFLSLPVLPKARSMAELCRQKRGVKFSIVFVTVRFWIVLTVFGEKAESTLTFSVKAQS
jgi:hypothetical protein